MDDDPDHLRRELRDPAELRALAHPVRLRLMEALANRGPATASQLSHWVDESPANCSWHLRQLARYGYIAETGGGRGRQRPWRIVPRGHGWGNRPEPASSELAMAKDEATGFFVDFEHEQLRDWVVRRQGAPPEWQESAFLTQNVAFLTPAELAELGRAVSALLVAYQDRLGDPTRRPPDARPVRLMAWGLPSREPGHAGRGPDAGGRDPARDGRGNGG